MEQPILFAETMKELAAAIRARGQAGGEQ